MILENRELDKNNSYENWSLVEGHCIKTVHSKNHIVGSSAHSIAANTAAQTSTNSSIGLKEQSHLSLSEIALQVPLQSGNVAHVPSWMLFEVLSYTGPRTEPSVPRLRQP